jgi:hypothetical protein
MYYTLLRFPFFKKIGEVLTWQSATGFLRTTLLSGVYCLVNPWGCHK